MDWRYMHDEIVVANDILAEVCTDNGWKYVLHVAACRLPETVTGCCERRYGLALTQESSSEGRLIAAWWTPRKPQWIARGIVESATLRSIIDDAQLYVAPSIWGKDTTVLSRMTWPVCDDYSLAVAVYSGQVGKYGTDSGRIGFVLLNGDGDIIAAWWRMGTPSFVDPCWRRSTDGAIMVLVEAQLMIDVGAK